MLISFAVTAKLICVFVFAYAKSQFSHDETHLTQYFCQIEALFGNIHRLACVSRGIKDDQIIYTEKQIRCKHNLGFILMISS